MSIPWYIVVPGVAALVTIMALAFVLFPSLRDGIWKYAKSLKWLPDGVVSSKEVSTLLWIDFPGGLLHVCPNLGLSNKRLSCEHNQIHMERTRRCWSNSLPI